MTDFDFVIVGGGMVGCSLALALATLQSQSNKTQSPRIALLEAKKKLGPDGRLLALNDNSLSFFQALNILPKIAPHMMPIHEVHVSAKGRFGSLRLQRQDLGLAKLGAVVPAHVIEKVLQEALQATDVVFMSGTKVTALDCAQDEVHLTTDQSTTLRANFILAADGSHSTIRNLLGVPTETLDYEQTAIVTQTLLNRSHHNIAYERLLADGDAIAMLPLSATTTDDGLSSSSAATIWTTSQQQAKKLLSLSDEEFLQALQAQFGYRLGRLLGIKQRFHYPIHYLQASYLANKRVFLVGNAAHTLHPMVALGFNVALYEIAFLCDRLLSYSSTAMPKAGSQCLNEGFIDVDLSVIATDLQQAVAKRLQLAKHLPQLLSSKLIKTMPGLISQGLMLMDLLPPVKKNFLRQLMGQKSLLPKLLSDYHA